MAKKDGDFGVYINNLRTRKGLSVLRLSHLSTVSASYISRLENEQRKTPQPNVLKKLAPHLGVSYTELLIKAGHLTKDSDHLIVLDHDTKELFASLTERKKDLLKIVDGLSEDTINILAQMVNELRNSLSK